MDALSGIVHVSRDDFVGHHFMLVLIDVVMQDNIAK
jgi:hypothetical protein